MRSNGGRLTARAALTELGAAAFGGHLDALMDVYASAMGVPAAQLPGRRSVMAAHVRNPAFRAIAVTAAQPPDLPPGPDGPVIAFCYGFHGEKGQWWHDLVRAGLTAAAGPCAAGRWLDDSFEIAELHVRPEYQRRGIGRRLLFRVTAGLTERTAVLSTMDADSPARRLYRSLGFTDLLTSYRFAGAALPYAVMGAALPLPAGRADSPRY